MHAGELGHDRGPPGLPSTAHAAVARAALLSNTGVAQQTLSDAAEQSSEKMSGCDTGPPEVPRRPLTLERLREVEQRPLLTEDQLQKIAGNLCCCLTEVSARPCAPGL
jgi:hypothetical protein